MEPTKRDTLTKLFDTARVDGVAYLLLIVALRSTTVKELRRITGASEPTVNGVLNHLESRHLVQRSGSGKADHWLPTPAVAQAFHQKIFGEPSSSSDLISDQNSDQIRSDSEDEERTTQYFLAQPLQAALSMPAPQGRDEEAQREYLIKCYLADKHYHLTGDKRAAYVENDSILSIHFEAWLHQVAAMKRSGVNIKHPAAYALTCCQRGDAPHPDHLYRAERELASKLRYFEQPDEEGGGDGEAIGEKSATEPAPIIEETLDEPAPALPSIPIRSRSLSIHEWNTRLKSAIERRNQIWHSLYANSLHVTAVDRGTLCLAVAIRDLEAVRAAAGTLLELAQTISADIVDLRIESQ